MDVCQDGVFCASLYNFIHSKQHAAALRSVLFAKLRCKQCPPWCARLLTTCSFSTEQPQMHLTSNSLIMDKHAMLSVSSPASHQPVLAVVLLTEKEEADNQYKAYSIRHGTWPRDGHITHQRSRPKNHDIIAQGRGWCPLGRRAAKEASKPPKMLAAVRRCGQLWQGPTCLAHWAVVHGVGLHCSPIWMSGGLSCAGATTHAP